MNELLASLGRRDGIGGQAWLLGLIVSVTLTFLVGVHVLVTALSLPLLLVHTGIWLAWLGWLAWIFPRTRRRAMGHRPEDTFRAAFYREILPGIAGSFSQIIRPAFEGTLSSAGPYASPVEIGAGALLATVGLTLIVLAVRGLGIAGTLFVREYSPQPPRLVSQGVLGLLRHPLFVGGSFLSLGGALTVGAPIGIALAVVNMLVIPAYVHFEDERCVQVFGDDYLVYRRGVGGALPRPAITAVPRLLVRARARAFSR